MNWCGTGGKHVLRIDKPHRLPRIPLIRALCCQLTLEMAGRWHGTNGPAHRHPWSATTEAEA